MGVSVVFVFSILRDDSVGCTPTIAAVGIPTITAFTSVLVIFLDGIRFSLKRSYNYLMKSLYLYVSRDTIRTVSYVERYVQPSFRLYGMLFFGGLPS